jgi:hypothetical protein
VSGAQQAQCRHGRIDTTGQRNDNGFLHRRHTVKV